ncbi:hypothetical protein FACS1894186_5380 [Alphaproteobacteria bacterium]|nr:hypothetical protein FACS1894186_5380 [Alphaproteobacteria bacterium]
MANLQSIQLANKNVKDKHTDVYGDFIIVDENTIQINTYGSPTSGGDQSQNLRIRKDVAIQLVELLSTAFKLGGNKMKKLLIIATLAGLIAGLIAGLTACG